MRESKRQQESASKQGAHKNTHAQVRRNPTLSPCTRTTAPSCSDVILLSRSRHPLFMEPYLYHSQDQVKNDYSLTNRKQYTNHVENTSETNIQLSTAQPGPHTSLRCRGGVGYQRLAYRHKVRALAHKRVQYTAPYKNTLLSPRQNNGTTLVSSVLTVHQAR